MISFKRFLVTNLKNEDSDFTWPECDFAEDAIRDKTFPKKVTSWPALRDYLHFHSAIDEAIDAGREAYKKWKLFCEKEKA